MMGLKYFSFSSTGKECTARDTHTITLDMYCHI